MGSYAVTGAGSGIGRATARRLADDGHQVIGVDRADGVDVTADLSTQTGRDAAANAVTDLCGGRLDGLVTAAGIGGSSTTQGGALIATNYFGSVRLLAALRPALAAAAEANGSAAVVCVGSNSATVQPDWPADLAELCLADDEAAAVERAEQLLSIFAYPAGKAALAWYVRERATEPEWIGAGIRLNVVLPGLTETAMTQAQRADPLIGGAISNFPVPIGRPCEPSEIADVIAFMLASPLLCGSVLVADGGTEAMLRPKDWPAAWRINS